MPAGSAGSAARTGGPEFIPAPSFDECYPWKKGDLHEPPVFQLFADRAPAMHLMILPGRSMLRASDDGWDADFTDSDFVQLWELGKQVRQQYATGENLAGADPVTFLMSIGCGDFYRWHVRISEQYARTGEGPTAQLAKQLFGLMRNPPADAIR